MRRLVAVSAGALMILFMAFTVFRAWGSENSQPPRVTTTTALDPFAPIELSDDEIDAGIRVIESNGAVVDRDCYVKAMKGVSFIEMGGPEANPDSPLLKRIMACVTYPSDGT